MLEPGAGEGKRDDHPARLRDDHRARLRDDFDVFAVRPRPRASPLRVLAIAALSIIVTGLLFRLAVDAVRMIMEP